VWRSDVELENGKIYCTIASRWFWGLRFWSFSGSRMLINGSSAIYYSALIFSPHTGFVFPPWICMANPPRWECASSLVLFWSVVRELAVKSRSVCTLGFESDTLEGLPWLSKEHHRSKIDIDVLFDLMATLIILLFAIQHPGSHQRTALNLCKVVCIQASLSGCKETGLDAWKDLVLVGRQGNHQILRWECTS